MAPDDLGTPLGPKRTRASAGRWKPPLLPLVTGLLGAAILVALGWALFVDDPLGGEPVAVVAIKTGVDKSPSPPAEPAVKPQEGAAGENSKQIVTIIDGKSGARTEVAVRPGADSGEEAVGAAPPLDARLSEVSRHGAIPRVAADGTRPLDAYSRADAATVGRKGPQIAIVVGGLGIGASTTGEAIAKLPGSITLAFVPYGSELSPWVTRARGAGHEVLLQVPMEPFDYPDNDPGPQTLLTTLSSAENIDRLHWFLSRTQGYIGVTSFMGARFTANTEAFAPVLSELAMRGLLYFDDAASSRSQTHKVAGDAKIPYLKGDVVIDAKPNWSDIDAALEQLERIAADKGFAVGTAGALPVSIERIARWVKAAETRGVRIVPLSALAARSKQS